jgi:hypothetical protein
MRRLLLVTAFLAGCGSITTQYGARTVEPGAREYHTAVTVGGWTDPVLGPVTVPRVDFTWRFGLAPDADLGLKLLGGAPAVDLRWRMVRSNRFDLAVAPGIAGAYIPIGLGQDAGLKGVTFFEVATPILAEWQLTPRSSVAAAARPGLRLVGTDAAPGGWYVSEDSVLVDVLTAGGVRYERRGNRFGWGLSLDVLGRPARSAPLGWSVAFDFFAVRHARIAQTERAVRRTAKGKDAPELRGSR